MRPTRRNITILDVFSIETLLNCRIHTRGIHEASSTHFLLTVFTFLDDVLLEWLMSAVGLLSQPSPVSWLKSFRLLSLVYVHDLRRTMNCRLPLRRKLNKPPSPLKLASIYSSTFAILEIWKLQIAAIYITNFIRIVFSARLRINIYSGKQAAFIRAQQVEEKQGEL